MTKEKFASHIERLRTKLYKTAFLYFGNEAIALDVVDETIYKALCSYHRLRQEELFDTWITRILINECHKEYRQRKRFTSMDELQEMGAEQYDSLPLKEAIRKLPKELKDVIILRYFAGYTLVETALALKIPQGTAATRQRKALKLLKLELGEEEMK